MENMQKYSRQEESRIFDILKDFCKPGTRNYFLDAELVYTDLDEAWLPAPEEAVEMPEDAPFEVEPMTDEEKHDMMAYRFEDSYLRSLGSIEDHALRLSEIIFQAEKAGFGYEIVNNEASRRTALDRITSHAGYNKKLAEFMGHRARSAMMLINLDREKLSEDAEKALDSAQKFARKVLSESYRTEPFAWLTKEYGPGLSRIIDVFGIKSSQESTYSDHHIAESNSNRLMTVDEGYLVLAGGSVSAYLNKLSRFFGA